MDSCPDPTVLRRLLGCLLSEAENATLSQHIDSCPRCRAMLDTLSDPGWNGPPPQLDGYDILGELGRGGMGVVYLAWQHRLRRSVALKMIRPGLEANAEQFRRFRIEAEAVAQIQHPNIVQIHGLDEHDGLPFLVLEFVDGKSLAERLRSKPWPAHDAARLVRDVAEAIHAAHERNIIHRDLKPSNVLLTARALTPKVTDFGVAKLLDEAVEQTQSGHILGTPAYMAPEQAAGQSRRVGPATDVYGLGATLYELLTGRPPFSGEDKAAILELVRNGDPVSPRRLRPGVPRDLETICLKCLRKDPQHRYASAADLAADLDRYLEGRSIRARPAGPVEGAWKLVRRRPVYGVAPLVVLLLASLAGIALAWRQAVVGANAAVNQRKQEADRLQRELYTERLQSAQRSLAAGEYGRARDQLDECPPHLRGLEWNLLARSCPLRHRRQTHDRFLAGIAFSPDTRWLAGVSSARDGPGVARLWDASTGEEAAAFPTQPGSTRCVAFSPQGLMACGLSVYDPKVGERWGTVMIWDVGARKELRTLRVGLRDVRAVAFSPDGTRLACGGERLAPSPASRGLVELWEIEPGRTEASFPERYEVLGVSFSHHGRLLACGTAGTEGEAAAGAVRVRDVASRKVVLDLAESAEVRAVAFSPTTPLLAAAVSRGAKVWDVSSGREVNAYRPDGPERVAGLAFSPDGKTLALAGPGTVVTLWEVSAGKVSRTLWGHDASLQGVAFGLDGKTLASAGTDGSMGLWGLTADREQPLTLGTGLAFSPDGTLAAGTVAPVPDPRGKAVVRVWAAAIGEAISTLRGVDVNDVDSLSFSRDGKRLAGSATETDPKTGAVRSSRAKVWDARTGAERFGLEGQQGHRTRVALNHAGDRLARTVGGLDPFPAGPRFDVELWDLASREKIRTLPGSNIDTVSRLAFSPDDGMLAGVVSLNNPRTLSLTNARLLDNVVRLWDTSTGKLTHTLQGHAQFIHDLAFSPDGAWLATAGSDSTVRLWDVRTGKAVHTLQHSGQVGSVAFSPDGQRLVTGLTGGLITIWAVAPGEAPRRLLHLEVRVDAGLLTRLRFCGPGGERLIAASDKGVVRVWDVRPLQEVRSR